MNETIYENIKALALEKRISIKNLEKTAGLGNGTIGKWIKSNPHIDKLAAVASVLEVTIDELITSKQ